MSSPRPPPVVRKASTRADDLLSGAETAARFVAEGVSGSGVKGLEGPAKTLLGIISHLKRVRDNSSACLDVIQHTGAITQTLKTALETIEAQITSQAVPSALVQAGLGSSPEFTSRVNQLQERLDAVNADVSQLQKQGRLKRIVLANRNADVLKGLSEKLQRAREEFMLRGQLAIEAVLRGVAEDVRANKERQAAAGLAETLNKLPHADAGYRASVHARHGRLLAGTRVDLLKDLDHWTSADNVPPFFVLRGGAGTGKSTVAFEVARRAEESGRLGASFFFMRGSALLSSTEVFFPTLVRQLVANVPALHAAADPLIQKHLKHGTRQNMDQQAKELFAALLATLPADQPPLVIVIDAVDECTESAQDLVPRMLFLILDCIADLSCTVRVLVTSRPEVHVEDAFQSVRFTSTAQMFRLQDVPKPVIDADIRLFFTTALDELPQTSARPLRTAYPDAADDLTDVASGLFIFATTAMEFLRFYRRADVLRGMSQLIETGRNASRPALQRLDDLYTIVLSSAFPPDVLKIQRRNIHVVLGCIAVLQDQISPRSLASLTEISLDHDVLPVVDRLGAVLSFYPEDPDAALRPLHASFGEFLVDPLRCTDPEFYVNPAIHHLAFAENCLELLIRPETLTRNVCRLPDTLVDTKDVADIASRMSRYIPGHVRYSCTYWPLHVTLSQGTSQILPLLTSFCSRRPLEWLEALAFLGSVDMAIRWLPVVRNLYSGVEIQDSPALLLNDVFRIAIEFSPAMRVCPQQIYASALPFLPSSSQLRQLYSGVLSENDTLRTLRPCEQAWTQWPDILPSGPDELNLVDVVGIQFAPHGRWLAIYGTDDGAIHICDPETGAIVQSINAHLSPVSAIDISSNGLRLVSSSPEGFRIVSTRSGAVIHELIASPYEGAIPCRAFFALEGESVLVVYTSDDGPTLHLWDPNLRTTSDLNCNTFEEVYPFVAVSSNGRWAVVIDTLIGSSSLTSDLEVNTGHVIDLAARAPAGRFDRTSAFAGFVPNTETIILGRNGSLCLCDVSSGAVLMNLGADETGIDAIAVSNNGSTVAALGRSSRESYVVHVWTLPEGSQRSISAGLIGCIDVSPDGDKIIGMLESSYGWRIFDLRVLEDCRFGDRVASTGAHGAVGISPDLSVIAVVTRLDLWIYHRNGSPPQTVTLPPAPAEVSTDLMLEDGRPHPDSAPLETVRETSRNLREVDVAFSSDSILVAIVYETSICVCDVFGHRKPTYFLRPIKRILEELGRLFDCSGVFPSFSCATFTPDGKELLAFIAVGHQPRIVPGIVCIVSWNLHDGTLISVSAFRVGVGEAVRRPGDYQRYRRALVDADMRLHFAIIDERGMMLSYSLSLTARDREERTTVVAEETTMPDERFQLSVDGWVSKVSTRQRLHWIPPPHRPNALHFHRTVASCGPLIATTTDTDHLTLIDMSFFDH